jgi:hypothetical protein
MKLLRGKSNTFLPTLYLRKKPTGNVSIFPLKPETEKRDSLAYFMKRCRWRSWFPVAAVMIMNIPGAFWNFPNLLFFYSRLRPRLKSWKLVIFAFSQTILTISDNIIHWDRIFLFPAWHAAHAVRRSEFVVRRWEKYNACYLSSN